MCVTEKMVLQRASSGGGGGQIVFAFAIFSDLFGRWAVEQYSKMIVRDRVTRIEKLIDMTHMTVRKASDVYCLEKW